MILPFNKRKIIYILFIAALLLLAANLIFNKLFLPDKTETLSGLTSPEIDSVFRTALFNVGIHEEWIKQKNENKEYFSVRIPGDLPMVLVLREMNELFDTSRVKIKSVEKKIGGATIINIISGGDEKLSAELIYNNKIKRKSVRVGFIIKHGAGSSESDLRLLEYPEQFALALIPSNSSAEFVKQVLNSGKEYVVYINDDITELKFKLSENYSPARLKNSIRAIVGTFPGALFFMIDNNSSLYYSDVYPLLKDELEKRKIKLIEEDTFRNLSAQPGENLTGTFNEALANLKGGEDQIFILSAGNFLQLGYEIVRYRKIGYRFINPSVALVTEYFSE
jgi:hypothetical protein